MADAEVAGSATLADGAGCEGGASPDGAGCRAARWARARARKERASNPRATRVSSARGASTETSRLRCTDARWRPALQAAHIPSATLTASPHPGHLTVTIIAPQY